MFQGCTNLVQGKYPISVTFGRFCSVTHFRLRYIKWPFRCSGLILKMWQKKKVKALITFCLMRQMSLLLTLIIMCFLVFEILIMEKHLWHIYYFYGYKLITSQFCINFLYPIEVTNKVIRKVTQYTFCSYIIKGAFNLYVLLRFLQRLFA